MRIYFISKSCLLESARGRRKCSSV